MHFVSNNAKVYCLAYHLMITDFCRYCPLTQDLHYRINILLMFSDLQGEKNPRFYRK